MDCFFFLPSFVRQKSVYSCLFQATSLILEGCPKGNTAAAGPSRECHLFTSSIDELCRAVFFTRGQVSLCTLGLGVSCWGFGHSCLKDVRSGIRSAQRQVRQRGVDFTRTPPLIFSSQSFWIIVPEEASHSQRTGLTDSRCCYR